jgi:hypothetical protein
MLEHIPENTTVRWEIRRPNNETAQHYRTGLARRKREKRVLTNLTAVGSHALLKLGSALTSAGKRLSGRKTSGRTAAAWLQH